MGALSLSLSPPQRSCSGGGGGGQKGLRPIHQSEESIPAIRSRRSDHPIDTRTPMDHYEDRGSGLCSMYLFIYSFVHSMVCAVSIKGSWRWREKCVCRPFVLQACLYSFFTMHWRSGCSWGEETFSHGSVVQPTQSVLSTTSRDSDVVRGGGGKGTRSRLGRHPCLFWLFAFDLA